MPPLPGSLSNPGRLLALCLIVVLVLGTNAILLSLFRRGPARGSGVEWSRALGGGRDPQRQQAAQLEELHQAVSELTAGGPDRDKPNG